MSRSDLTIAAAFGLALAAAVAALTFGGLGGDPAPDASAAARGAPAPGPPTAPGPAAGAATSGTATSANAPASSPPPAPHHLRHAVPTLHVPPVNGPAFGIINVASGAEVPVYSRPGGELLTTLGDHTEFGAKRTFSVVRSHNSWFGVIAPELANNQVGWVRFNDASMDRYWTKYRLDADLSAQTLTISYGKQRIASYTVTVGGPGSETPKGRFAITDGITFDSSPYYGCCAIVTNGHQTSLPPGWLGGDRIAIHGTDGPVGGAASHGCLRATDDTMRALMARVPLGTPLLVRG